jgi:hypothetical protein
VCSSDLAKHLNIIRTDFVRFLRSGFCLVMTGLANWGQLAFMRLQAIRQAAAAGLHILAEFRDILRAGILGLRVRRNPVEKDHA